MATLDMGNGADGNVTITSNKNLNTDAVIGSRTYADMVGYNVTAIGNNNVTAGATPNGIIAGDKVILINIQGDGTYYDNVGNYEIFTVDTVVSTTITFTANKTLYYGDGASSDSGLAVGDGLQKFNLVIDHQ